MIPMMKDWHRYRLRLPVRQDHQQRLRDAFMVQYGLGHRVSMNDEELCETCNTVIEHPAGIGIYGTLDG